MNYRSCGGRIRRERASGHADVDFEAAFNLADDMAFDAAPFVERLLDFFPDLNALRALAR